METSALRIAGITGLVALIWVGSATWTNAGMGDIKRFVRFPVETFELKGKLAPEVLEESSTPSPSEISVDGWWPDKKLLLISFGGDSRYVLFRAVEMNDQATWDARMVASSGLVCGGWRQGTRRTGGDPNAQTAATKGFANPC